MGFINWIKGAGNWINEKILQPVGRWGSSLWRGLTGKGHPNEGTNDVATNAGYQSGQWFRSFGLPLIKSTAKVFSPQVAAGIDEMQKGVERISGESLG